MWCNAVFFIKTGSKEEKVYYITLRQEMSHKSLLCHHHAGSENPEITSGQEMRVKTLLTAVNKTHTFLSNIFNIKLQIFTDFFYEELNKVKNLSFNNFCFLHKVMTSLPAINITYILYFIFYTRLSGVYFSITWWCSSGDLRISDLRSLMKQKHQHFPQKRRKSALLKKHHTFSNLK